MTERDELMKLPLHIRAHLGLYDRESGEIARKELEDGRYALMVPLTYGRVRITLSDAGELYTWHHGY